MQFATTVFICQLSNVFALRGGKKRLKGESGCCDRRSYFKFVYVSSHIFSFVKSRLLKRRSHVPSTVGPGKERLTSTFGVLTTRSRGLST